MRAKIVSIDRFIAVDTASDAFHASAAAFTKQLEELAVEHPGLLGVGWIVDGVVGNLAVMYRGTEGPLCGATAREQAQALAWVINRFPPSLREAFENELDWIRADRQSKQAPQSSQDAPADSR